MKNLFLTVQMCLITAFSLANGGVVIKASPDRSNGYLCWEATNFTNYEVLILEKKINSSQVVYYDTLTTMTPSTNFVRIDPQYMGNADYFYKINIKNSNGGLEAESDFSPACGDCGESLTDYCYWTCNGADYSWKLQMAFNDEFSNGNLRVMSGYQYTDDLPGVAVPFYQAMSYTAYTAGGPYLGYSTYSTEGVLSGDDIRDAHNNVLTGTVYFVEKKMEQFAPLSSIYTDVIGITPANCGNNISWGIGTYNAYAESTLPIDLACQGVFTSYENGEEDDTSTVWNFWSDISEYWDGYDPTIGDLLAGLPGLSATGQDWMKIDRFDHVVSSISVNQIDGDSVNHFTIDPTTIFDTDSTYNAPSLNINSGLYRVTFIFEDGSAIPITFEHNASTYVPVTNASFAEVVIAPNPIQNDELKLDISTERKMSFTLNIQALSGTTLYTEQMNMDADENVQKTIAVTQGNYPYNQLVVKLVFSDGSTLQEIAIRP